MQLSRALRILRHMERFDGEVVVVTGASSGIGRAVARAFGAAGARVALVARNPEALGNAAGEIARAGGEASVFPIDVADAGAVEGVARSVVERWGCIDVWVNNAMVTVLSPAMEMTPHEYRRVTEVTYLGTVYGTLAAIRRMRPRNRGLVLQIGSALAYRSIPLQSAYCGSKAAIRGFTDSLRSELLHDRSAVRICMLQLPAVNTPQFVVARTRLPRQPMPVPPVFQPEVIARAVLYVARHPTRELWIAGSTWKAILSAKVAGPIGDRVLAREGYSGQQTDEPIDPDRPDNLDHYVPGDRGAHGPFDDLARGRSLELWARMHRGALAALAALGLGATSLAWRAR
ncbi:MAG TPA: SDR family oxidoreductase [Myxococcaceae bacterium]|nr:SDR family oxidoreductase [Myxococcaceae bacterium]